MTIPAAAAAAYRAAAQMNPQGPAAGVTPAELPGSSFCGFFHFAHLSLATCASFALSISESFSEGCPAHPELDPSAIRIVVVNCESLEL